MARDKTEKMWIAGGVVSSLVLAGALWSFVVSPQMDEVDSLHSKTADAQLQNLTLQGNVSRLKSAYDHIDVGKRQLAQAQTQLPSDSGLSGLTTQLNKQAAAHHVKITQLTAAAPVLAVAAAPTGSTTPSPAPAASTSTTGGTSAAGQLYVIQVSVAVSGAQADELAFAKDVQHAGPRSALIGSVQLQDGDTSGQQGSSLTMQMNVYVAPVAPPAQPSASPSAPA